MPQHLQGNTPSNNGDLPRTLPADLSNNNSGVSSPQNAKDEITKCPDKMTGNILGTADSSEFPNRRGKTETALEPAIGLVKTGGCPCPLGLCTRVTTTFTVWSSFGHISKDLRQLDTNDLQTAL